MIQYVKGDALDPVVKNGVIIICHCVNNVGAFGAGFAKAVADKYPFHKQFYLDTCQKHPELGGVEFNQLEAIPGKYATFIVDMYAQNGLRSADNTRPLDYVGLANCFYKLVAELQKKDLPYTIHMPRIGCGLAGGDWHVVEGLIDIILNDYNVYVYDL